MNTPAIRLFRTAVYGWLALYMLSMLLLGDAAWTNAPVELFHARGGFTAFAQRRMDLLANGYGAYFCIATLLIAAALIRRHRWWLALLAWLLSASSRTAPGWLPTAASS